MITNVAAVNFKCFRELDISPKMLTVLIGPNGTGKSGVLQALLLLKQSAGEERIQYQGEFVNLADPSEIVPKFLSPAASFQLTFAGKSVGFHANEDVEYQWGGEFSASGWMLDSFGKARSSIDGAALCISKKKGTGLEPHLIHAGDGYINFLINPSIGSLADFFTASGGTDKETDAAVMRMTLASRKTLDSISYVPSVRGLIRPRYPLGDQLLDDVSLEAGLSGQEEQTASNLGYSRPLEERLSDLMKRVTGTGLRADIVPPQSVEVKSIVSAGTVNMVAEGFGANSLILLLHQLLNAKKGATVLIEEPEIHLHPKAQADLAEVLADTAKAEEKQIIMTTHSEYVAGRLLTLVAEGSLTIDELAIYAFHKDAAGGCSSREIEVTGRGQVKGGLAGFHDATRDEMRRYADGLRNRE
jgi:energy-coupling factor transporter ATP-binding protein EcfA2